MLHGAIVHFPIVLLFVAGGFYFFAMLRPSTVPAWLPFGAHLLGLVGIVAAVLSGGNAESNTIHTRDIHDLIERHELLGYIALWVFALAAIWQYVRGRAMQLLEKRIFILVFAVLLGLLAYSSHIGGRLVYQYGAGVEPMQPVLREQLQQQP